MLDYRHVDISVILCILHFQYFLPFLCNFSRPGLQVVDGPMRSIASGAERGGGGMEASRDYLGLEGARSFYEGQTNFQEAILRLFSLME